MFGWFKRAERARIMAVVEKLERATAPRAPEQARACNAVDVLYPLMKGALKDLASDEVIDDLTGEMISALIKNGML